MSRYLPCRTCKTYLIISGNNRSEVKIISLMANGLCNLEINGVSLQDFATPIILKLMNHDISNVR